MEPPPDLGWVDSDSHAPYRFEDVTQASGIPTSETRTWGATFVDVAHEDEDPPHEVDRHGPVERRLPCVGGRSVLEHAEVTRDRGTAHGEVIRELADLARSGMKSDDFREIVGFTAKQAEAVAGISGENVLYLVDEASGVPRETLLGRRDAEAVLRALELAYRIVLLAAGDLSFANAKCYDLEAWAPGEGRWLEVSSCSNFEDFQARRCGIRFRPERGAKPEFVHTLNASGVALPRTFAALLETHQTERGTIRIPEALVPYLDGVRELTPGQAWPRAVPIRSWFSAAPPTASTSSSPSSS